jgi:hypothetical protein
MSNIHTMLPMSHPMLNSITVLLTMLRTQIFLIRDDDDDDDDDGGDGGGGGGGGGGGDDNHITGSCILN